MNGASFLNAEPVYNTKIVHHTNIEVLHRQRIMVLQCVTSISKMSVYQRINFTIICPIVMKLSMFFILFCSINENKN